MTNNFPYTDDIEQLFLLAWEYDRHGDVYNAVKLYKRVIKLAPDWSAPFSFLSLIYKNRNEWKSALHYSLKAIEHNPFDETAWQNVGIAATALKKWKMARGAWNQLGFAFQETDKAIHQNLGMTPVRLHPLSKPEIIWAKRIDPVRATIESIPQPSSGRNFKDLILLDSRTSGYHLNGKSKMDVFDELEVIRPSLFKTYTLLLHTSSLGDVRKLERLCQEANLGFDNWSKATRIFLKPSANQLPEYFNEDIVQNFERETFLIALAAKADKPVLAVLKSWKIISLKDYSDLHCVG